MTATRVQAGLPRRRSVRGVTPRQKEVLVLVAVGCPNKEIAERLGISQPGVKKHLESLGRRYAATNRMQIVRSAMERGDIDTPHPRTADSSQATLTRTWRQRSSD